MQAFDKIGEQIQSFVDGEHQLHPYYHFEPWDVEKRPEWMIQQALEDGIDLYDEKLLPYIGADPHPFQSGYMLSTSFFNGIVAGTSSGKSIAAAHDGVIMMSGEIPIALRYPDGHDTRVKRIISKENIARWGRRDSSTGAIIDHNEDAPKPESWDEWNCGTIIGVGEYPKEKISTPGGELWIGTYHEAMNKFWWPRFFEENTLLFPKHLIDRSKGNNGYSLKKKELYLVRDCKISILTYEEKFNRFEAQRVWGIKLDEEPTDERIYQACQQRCKYLSLSETPYHGITYTKRVLYPQKISPHRKLWHATQYDSPYQNKELITIRRQDMNPWDIGARVYGFHSEITGKPYFDRQKITTWIQKFPQQFKLKRFIPKDEYFGIVQNLMYDMPVPCLMDTPVDAIDVAEDDLKTTWRVYEDAKPGVAYFMPADPAEGSIDPLTAADVCAADIMRPPDMEPDANGEPKEDRPVLAASLRSTLETIPFAKTCSYALRHYNNALLAAETKRAACNAAFASELREWPYWYHHISEQQTNRQKRKQQGWDTNAATRSAIFDLIKEWINSFEEDEYPCIPDEPLLIELAAAVVGKGGRCDHTTEGTLDSAITFGIGLYITKHSPEQIVFNGDAMNQDNEPFGKLKALIQRGKPEDRKPAVYLGDCMPNWRR